MKKSTRIRPSSRRAATKIVRPTRRRKTLGVLRAEAKKAIRAAQAHHDAVKVARHIAAEAVTVAITDDPAAYRARTARDLARAEVRFERSCATETRTLVALVKRGTTVPSTSFGVQPKR